MAIKIGDNTTVFKVGSTDVNAIYLGDTLIYSGSTPPTPHDYSQDYLTFRALEDGTFKFSGNRINYSLDSGVTWTELASNTKSPTVQSGQTIMWKAELRASDFVSMGTFSSSGQFEVEGNAMSLKYGDNFRGQTTLNDNNSFSSLFANCGGLTSAENLVLPATTLTVYCYRLMFAGCTSLTTAPVLSATTLKQQCYDGMFSGCTSLTTAPELPATTLTSYCYRGMFYNCTSLNTAPVLPAATLTNVCYQNMFYGCSSLNSITCLATDISASNCTQNWVRSVGYIGTFYKAASMNDWDVGANGVPAGWTLTDYSS